MMQHLALVALLSGASALVGPGGKIENFALQKCRKDTRTTQLKAEDLNTRLLHLKAARPWMLEKYDASAVKETAPQAAAAPAIDLHVKRSDAMCARAEAMQASSEVSREEILNLRKKCLEARIKVAKAKKAEIASSSLLEGKPHRHPKVQMNEKEEETLVREGEAINIKKIYYVNMDKDTDRKKFMEGELKDSGVEYERLSAVTREEIAKMPQEKGLPRELGLFSNQGNSDYMKWFPEKARQVTQAIYLSQARLLQKISTEDNNSDDVYIVMEDDVALNKNWKEELMQKAKTLPKDWDVAKFAYWGIKRCEDKVPDSDWYEFRGPSMWTDQVSAVYSGNQAYMFRAKSIKNILEQLRGMPVMDVDGALISNHQEKTEKINGVESPTVWGLHSYAIDMPLGKHKQNKFRSSRWDNTEFSNPAVAASAIARTIAR